MSGILQKLRDFDTVDTIEKLGIANDDTLLLKLEAAKNTTLRTIAKESKDLHFGSAYQEGVHVLRELGFKCIEYYQYLYRIFDYEKFSPEHFSVWFHYKYGVLVTLESYSGAINTINLFCNWDQTGPNKPRCSGGYVFKCRAPEWMLKKQDEEFKRWENDNTYHMKYYHHHGFVTWNNVQALHLDAREFLKVDFRKFLDNGKFLPIWMERPCMFNPYDLSERKLIYPPNGYTSDCNARRDEIVNRHISRWPEEVRLRITPGARF